MPAPSAPPPRPALTTTTPPPLPSPADPRVADLGHLRDPVASLVHRDGALGAADELVGLVVRVAIADAAAVRGVAHVHGHVQAGHHGHPRVGERLLAELEGQGGTAGAEGVWGWGQVGW